MVPAFKKPPGKELGVDETTFNTMLAKGRIKVEHCIGILKGRFQRLRELRVLLRNYNDQVRCTRIITGAIILHNMLLNHYYPSQWIRRETDMEANAIDGNIRNENADNTEMREQMLRHVLAHVNSR